MKPEQVKSLAEALLDGLSAAQLKDLLLKGQRLLKTLPDESFGVNWYVTLGVLFLNSIICERSVKP